MKSIFRYCAVLFVATTFASVKVNAQTATLPLLDSLTLDTMTAYTDLAVAMQHPDQVVKLVLKHEGYTAFPKEIWSFPNLQYLDLSKNRITDYPDTLGKLVNLQVLHLSKNRIESLPRELGDNVNLTILDINQNMLTMIPPQIGKLKKLKYLDLWSNDISIFPEEFKDIAGNLQTLDLRVIIIPYTEQNKIRAELPNTTIYFSPPCHCSDR